MGKSNGHLFGLHITPIPNSTQPPKWPFAICPSIHPSCPKRLQPDLDHTICIVHYNTFAELPTTRSPAPVHNPFSCSTASRRIVCRLGPWTLLLPHPAASSRLIILLFFPQTHSLFYRPIQSIPILAHPGSGLTTFLSPRWCNIALQHDPTLDLASASAVESLRVTSVAGSTLPGPWRIEFTACLFLSKEEKKKKGNPSPCS